MRSEYLQFLPGASAESAIEYSFWPNSFVVLKRIFKPMGIPRYREDHYLKKLAEGLFGDHGKKDSPLIKLSELYLLPLNYNTSEYAVKNMDSRIWPISVLQVVIIAESSAYEVIIF